MEIAINCPSCGAKIRADRERCPKCRTWLIDPDPARASLQSRRFAYWAVGLLSAFVVIVGGLWLFQGGDPARVTAAAAVDPFAARRQARPPAPAPQPEAPAAAAPVRPFSDDSARAAASYATGDYGSALEHYQAVIERNPQDAEAHSNLGQVLVRLGRVEEALPHFDHAIEQIPDRWAYHFNRARALGLLNRWDEAIAGYRRAQTLFPDDYATTFNLALALHKKGDDAAAVEEYKRAIALAPEDASFRFALALSYERLRRTAEAAEAYEEYLRLAPQAGDAEQVRTRIAQLRGTTSDGQAGSQSERQPL